VVGAEDTDSDVMRGGPSLDKYLGESAEVTIGSLQLVIKEHRLEQRKLKYITRTDIIRLCRKRKEQNNKFYPARVTSFCPLARLSLEPDLLV
jgi:hypothetical protein